VAAQLTLEQERVRVHTSESQMSLIFVGRYTHLLTCYIHTCTFFLHASVLRCVQSHMTIEMNSKPYSKPLDIVIQVASTFILEEEG
jgi:hypothetical protein